MRNVSIEDCLDYGHVSESLRKSSRHLQSLVVRYTQDQTKLLTTGHDSCAQSLEERRKTLSQLRKQIQDLSAILAPVDGLLD